MASYSSDPMADYQSAKAELQSAKKKVEMYQNTLKKIPRQGVHLGEIMDVDRVDTSHNVMHLLENLENLVQPRAFCCGGWIELGRGDADARLKMRADETNQLGWPITKLPVDSLLEFCTPAQYGDLNKQETVYNPEVRLASECEASKFTLWRKVDGRRRFPFSLSPFALSPLFLDVIRQKVSSTLANGKDVVLECYKLNVYGKGGFFNAHVDTPVDPARMIGTVVVCLPCWHTGGVLTVKHQGVQEEFAFADRSGDRSLVQWAAFYSDCIHEILPVKDGNRITLTYNIIRKKARDGGRGALSFGRALCKQENSFTGQVVAVDKNATLDSIVSDIIEIGSGEDLEQFGIFLRYKYTMSALAAGNLKGCDQVLHDGMTSRGLTCHRLTVLVHELEKKPDEDGENYWQDEEERGVYAFSQEDMAYVNKQGPKPSHAFWKDMQFVKDWSKEQVLIERKETQARNCGNWTEPGEIDRLYLQSALIVDIPNNPPSKSSEKGGNGNTSEHGPGGSGQS